MSLSPHPSPNRDQIESMLLALLDGSQSRDEVDRWAAQWVTDPDGGGVEDADVWWALTQLHGIDLRHAKDGPYLHDDEQIRHWLHAFRARRPRAS
ncbi:hypothetical protein JMF97_28320 [Micromonospora fiedleri]|uniref:Uncharacterized protein n=1 Tax=Micromonospora fiedleri TaxID=1157498 RepID=A0ABS1UUT4_9ACTN|nr:hypothetical protein [Micromonospora fiedleri]MBL6280072.1 hypothetical protein [Micromonospora fiedleri]